MKTLPKYSILEIERKWLVKPTEAVPLLELSHLHVEDRYILGTQLRLRKVSGFGIEPVFKFCKKYGKSSTTIVEPITNLYLTSVEYEVLSQLPATVVHKRRYAVSDGALDLYEQPNTGLIVFEMEFESESQASAYQPPPFVSVEVTHDVGYSGAILAQPR